VRWLDSGAAIARRVGDVLGAAAGAASAARLAFTDAEHAHGLAPALRARGFQAVAEIAADFTVSPPRS
jgi:hypothetical protein